MPLRILVAVLVALWPTASRASELDAQATNILISPGQRILVAGFVAESEGTVDVNAETVRLLRAELRRQGALGVIQSEPLALTGDGVFRDTAYWHLVGEEYGHPLIVTGTVRLRRAPPQVSQRGGRAGVYSVRPGLLLEVEVLLIDGTSGRVLSSKRLPRQSQYGSIGRESPVSMYQVMIDSLMPELLRAVLAPPSRYAPPANSTNDE